MGRRLLAVLAGAVVAAGIMSALDFWQQRLMDQLRREEAEAAVNDMIAAAEHRIAAALASLDELAQAGIESCRGHHLGALRRVAGANPWIKDVIVAEAGAIRCSATEALAGRRELAAALAAGGEGPRLAVLNPGERDAQLLVIRPGGGAFCLRRSRQARAATGSGC
jgi:sensor c-di-GMP phosphodiesterase-like protein